MEDENEGDEDEEGAGGEEEKEDWEGLAELHLLQLVQHSLFGFLLNVAGNGDIHELVDGGVVFVEEGVKVGGGTGTKEGVSFQAHLEGSTLSIFTIIYEIVVNLDVCNKVKRSNEQH